VVTPNQVFVRIGSRNLAIAPIVTVKEEALDRQTRDLQETLGAIDWQMSSSGTQNRPFTQIRRKEI